MTPFDWFVFALYLIVTAAVGFWCGRRLQTSEDYFLGARRVPWPTAMLSLVATETSAVTVVAIPAMAYSQGGDLGFLQCAAGFAIGKIIIAIFILPSFFRRELVTPYQFLGSRLGRAGQRAGALLFIAALYIGAAFRIYVGAIPLAEATELGIQMCLLIISLLAIAYTLMGGLRAVIYTDVLQMILFITGGVVAFAFILTHLPEGMSSFWSLAEESGKTKFFDSGLRESSGGSRYYDWTQPHTIFAGLIGAAVVTLATHGTDHSNLQRLLACQSLGRAQTALVVSAGLVIFQFALFLFVGIALHVFYQTAQPPPELVNNNRILPYFIIHELPSGLTGLLIAGIFAAAMSTVDSALSALSATTVTDLRSKRREGSSEESRMGWARWSVFVWGLLLWFGAIGAWKLGRENLVNAVFTVANSLYGPLLGVFLIALLLHKDRGEETDGGNRSLSTLYIPFAIGLAVQSLIFALGREEWMGDYTFKLAWPWITLTGAVGTFVPAWILKRLA